MAPGSTANGVAVCCCGINAGGGAVGACCPPGNPGDPGKPPDDPGKPPGDPGKLPGGLGNGNCGPKNLGSE